MMYYTSTGLKPSEIPGLFISTLTNIRSQIVLNTSKYDCICAQPTSLDNGLQRNYIVLLKANFYKLTTNTVSSYFTQ